MAIIRLSSTLTNAPKFPLGQIVATPGALEALGSSDQNPLSFLDRHAKGDWGEMCNEDCDLNNQAVVDGSRILSAYTTDNSTKIWIVSEATDDIGKRSATTILLPEEY